MLFCCRFLKGEFMEIPLCCGSRMQVKLEFGRFLEAECGKCGDVAYIKLHSTAVYS